MQAFLQQIIYGIQLGSLYALIALGYTMVYGVLRLINFAHGDVYMVGAYVGFYCCTSWLPFQDLTTHPGAATTNIALAIVALLLSMVLCSMLGIVIERFAYRPLRNGLQQIDAHFWGAIIALPIASHFVKLASLAGVLVYAVAAVAIGFAMRPVMTYLRKHTVLSTSRLNALITAIGVSLALENGGLLVFGSDQKFIGNVLPEGTVTVFGIQFSSGQSAIFIVSVILMLGLRYVVLYTRRGKAMRAISHDIEAAKLMGIDTDRVISFTFALGASLAGAGGAMVAMLTHVKINTLFGLQPGLKAFVAAVLGGAGNIPGAALGGVVMGVAESVVAGSKFSTYKDAIAFCLLIGVLLFRPAGLLGKNVAEKV
ncbi:MAG: branched-chain amino acid ABC transporter permease [Chthonomonadales bacterium]